MKVTVFGVLFAMLLTMGASGAAYKEVVLSLIQSSLVIRALKAVRMPSTIVV